MQSPRNAESLSELSKVENADPTTINSVQFDPDGKRVVSGGYSGTIKVWNASTHSLIVSKDDVDPDGISSVSFSPDGTKIVSGGSSGTIKVWKAGAIRLRIASLSPKLTSLAFPGRHAGACE